MRQGQQNKRMRGRNRKGPNPLTRSYESNGPDVKIRGTALHIAEKYVQLARDAQSSGDRVAGENYLQHAEHYYRLVAAAQAQMPQPQPVFRSDDEGDEEDGGNFGYPDRQSFPRQGGQAYGVGEPQPYVNGNGQDGGQGEDEPMAAMPPPPQPDEQRFEPRQNDGGGGGREGGYRSRRRRPYRDRYGDQGQGGGERQGGQPASAQGDHAPAPPAGDE